MACHDQDVTLLSFWPSPFSMRVKLALLLKGIEHEDLPQDLGNKSKLLLESNPVHKKVPVLIHKGKPIAESAIIVHYIDEVWPGTSPLLPQDAFLRAQHRFWTDFFEKKISDYLDRFIRSNGAAVNEEFIQDCLLLEGALAELGDEEEGPFFGGASMSFLDVMLAPSAVWIPALEQVMGLKPASQEQCPRLHKLFGAVTEHPSAKVALPQIEKLKEFTQARLVSNSVENEARAWRLGFSDPRRPQPKKVKTKVYYMYSTATSGSKQANVGFGHGQHPHPCPTGATLRLFSGKVVRLERLAKRPGVDEFL